MGTGDRSHMADKPQLIYFANVGGRAEPICYLLRLAKADFNYEQFPLGADPEDPNGYEKRKAAGEFSPLSESGGGLPVYKEGGKTYFETNAILRMLGAKHGFYSTEPDTMWEIDMCIEQAEQIFKHAGYAQHSLYCIAMLKKASGEGDGPDEATIENCFAMYEKFVNFVDAQLVRHGTPFIAGTEKPTIADLRFMPQFANSIYNAESALGEEMQKRVKAFIDTKPAAKKWAEETMVGVLEGVHTPSLLW